MTQHIEFREEGTTERNRLHASRQQIAWTLEGDYGWKGDGDKIKDSRQKTAEKTASPLTVKILIH